MKFEIIKLYKDINPYFTGSFSGLVDRAKVRFTETIGENEASFEFVQPMNYIGWDSSSFFEYNNLTEEQVKGWVTSSYEIRKTICKTSDGTIHPTGSWSEFTNSVSSSLYNQVSNGLPW